MVKLRRAEHYKRMPWKNGGGETREIAVFPEAADMDDFGWRISMAHVAQDGPFSLFPGIDRTLVVLDGNGILLDISGRTPVLLERGSAPFSFPADSPTMSILKSGPITDLNVMTRRGHFTHEVSTVALAGDKEERICVDAGAVFCLDGHVIFITEGQTDHLYPYDSLIHEGDAPHHIQLQGKGTLVLIRIHSGKS